MTLSNPTTLEDAYADTAKRCYYYGKKFPDITPSKSPIEFIQCYLERAKKEGIFPNKNYLELLERNDQRCSHTVSAFLLGILIYDNVKKLKTKINALTCRWEKHLKLNNKEPSRQRFLYSWFLCCLCHDLGYLYEKPVSDRLTPSREDIQKKIESGLKEYNTPERLFGLPVVLGKNMPRYALARLNGKIGPSGETIDHGIAGGILLYDTMKKYHEAKTQIPEHRMKEIFESYGRAIAWTIFCHNMWFVDRNDPEATKDIAQYYVCGLHELVTNKCPFEWNKHPLFTLLCLVDTIEPVKLFKEDVDILNKISIEFGSDRMSLSYYCRFPNNCCSLPCYIPPSIKDKLWFLANEHLQVSDGGNCLTIQFQ